MGSDQSYYVISIYASDGSVKTGFIGDNFSKMTQLRNAKTFSSFEEAATFSRTRLRVPRNHASHTVCIEQVCVSLVQRAILKVKSVYTTTP